MSMLAIHTLISETPLLYLNPHELNRPTTVTTADYNATIEILPHCRSTLTSPSLPLRSYLPPTSTCVYFHCESLRACFMFSLLFLVRFYGCVTAPLTGPACILQRFLWTNIILTHCRVYGKPSYDESLLNLREDKVQLLKQLPLLPV